MAKIKNFEDYCALVDEVKVHDYKYFAQNAPSISDEEYDALYFALQEYEDAHPDDILKDSPTQRCYSENGNGKRTVARRTACLSMKKLHDAKAVVKYLRAHCQYQQPGREGRYRVEVRRRDREPCVSPWLALRSHLRTWQRVVRHRLSGTYKACARRTCPGGRMETVRPCRGEVIISLEEFARYSKAGKSPRSTSNGIMAKKVAVTNECKRLEFHPFRLIMDGVIRHTAAMQALERNDFKTSGFVSALNLEKTDAELEQDIENIVCSAEVERESLPYPTDGLVFKFDNYDYYDRIGQTDHDAKYNCAFKFRPVFKAVTTYRGHHTTVGEKTGKVTYVADFDEVEMNGHRFAHANCGSKRTFLQKDLTPGCKIEVSLHGDVIVCVDGKVDEEPTVEEEPIIDEEPLVIDEEPLVIDEEPLVIGEAGIVHHPEPHVIESEINQSQESEAEPEPIPQPEPEPAPQPKPKRKRYYPQVGEPTLREEREGTEEAFAEDKGLSVKKVLAGALAVLMAVSAGVLMLAFAGAAVFLMPMIGGLTKE